MSVLDIEHKGGENYIFSAKGCHLKYFVIWAEGDTPRWEPIDGYIIFMFMMEMNQKILEEK